MEEKMLVIRMMGLGDVTCIGIPAIRHIIKLYPNTHITLLTHGPGRELVSLAEPNLRIIHLESDDWPKDMIKAMAAFLKLANQLIGESFTRIINLDTWFMPCLLARFLKDAGEPLEGNYLSKPVDNMLAEYASGKLHPSYVKEQKLYMHSTFTNMPIWHTVWWQNGVREPRGYPEFYLRHCCGFTDIEMNMRIHVPPDSELQALKDKQKVIALACKARTSERHYPFEAELKQYLEAAGYYVWIGFDGSVPMDKTLSMLKATDLLVTVPSAPQWLATSVGCPSFVVSGKVDPRTLAPDYATPMSAEPFPAKDVAEAISEVLGKT